MPFTLEIRLSDQLKNRLKQRIAIFEHTAQLMLEHMEEAVAMGRIRCPVKTGYMQSRIGIVDFNPDEPSIAGGVTGVPYAKFNEFGTSKMAARPFWRPAVWEAFFRLLEDLKKLNRGENLG